MNILDEQVPESQRQLLRSWRIPVRQIGHDVGRKGMKDREILTLLIQLNRPTFFTLDDDFSKRELCHQNYSLVFMDIKKHEAATFVRRLLRHPMFDTIAKRLGLMLCLSHTNIAMLSLHAEQKQYVEWIDKFKVLR